MKTAFVTGGSGFIGCHMCRTLEAEGYSVINYDLKNGCNILDKVQLKGMLSESNPDEVYHLAAQAFVGPGEKDPYLDLEINGKGMLNLLTALTELRDEKGLVPPTVFSSSGSVYGLTDSFPHKENALIKPTANYGCTKRLAEIYMQKWAIMAGLNIKAVRFSSVYGPGRGFNGPVNIFIELTKQMKPLTVYGDGSQTRDLLYIDDAISGLRHVLKHGVPGEIYNIGSGVETSVLQVAQIISKYTENGYRLVEGHKFSKFDVARSYYDINKIRSIGWAPKYLPDEGIKHLLKLEGII